MKVAPSRDKLEESWCVYMQLMVFRRSGEVSHAFSVSSLGRSSIRKILRAYGVTAAITRYEGVAEVLTNHEETEVSVYNNNVYF